MDSTINIRVRITHLDNLPLDAQGIADLAGRLLTEAMKADPSLLVTATVNGAVIQSSRRQYVEGCGYCEYVRSIGVSGPRHDASPQCESGSHPHCTCDTCF